MLDIICSVGSWIAKWRECWVTIFKTLYFSGISKLTWKVFTHNWSCFYYHLLFLLCGLCFVTESLSHHTQFFSRRLSLLIFLFFFLLFYWKGKPAFKMWEHGKESVVVFSLESFISLIWNTCVGRTLIMHNCVVNQSWSNRRLLVHHHLLSPGL